MFLMYLPSDQVLNCGLLLMACVVTFTSVCNNIFANIFNFANIRQVWIWKVEQQFNVTICPPAFKERSAMLNCSFGMGSLHPEVVNAFLIFHELCLFHKVHTWRILPAKMLFITKANATSTWLFFLLSWRQNLLQWWHMQSWHRCQTSSSSLCAL